jgi:hypothetical protein
VLEQDALSGPRAPDDRGYLARRNLEVESIENGAGPEAFDQTIQSHATVGRSDRQTVRS